MQFSSIRRAKHDVRGRRRKLLAPKNAYRMRLICLTSALCMPLCCVCAERSRVECSEEKKLISGQLSAAREVWLPSTLDPDSTNFKPPRPRLSCRFHLMKQLQSKTIVPSSALVLHRTGAVGSKRRASTLELHFLFVSCAKFASSVFVFEQERLGKLFSCWPSAN
jgi:hypothetical protein